MNGEVGILNVGAGDTKLSFDPANEADRIRAARVVKDMIRRGYALLVEVEEDGKKINRRVHDFDDTKFEYIIADFDPLAAKAADDQERTDEEAISPATPQSGGEMATPARPGRGKYKRRIPAHSARAVAVPHIAGG